MVGCNFPVGFGVGFDKLIEGVAIEILDLEMQIKDENKRFFQDRPFLLIIFYSEKWCLIWNANSVVWK